MEKPSHILDANTSICKASTKHAIAYKKKQEPTKVVYYTLSNNPYSFLDYDFINEFLKDWDKYIK